MDTQTFNSRLYSRIFKLIYPLYTYKSIPDESRGFKWSVIKWSNNSESELVIIFYSELEAILYCRELNSNTLLTENKD